MRTALLLSCVLVSGSSLLAQQTPPQGTAPRPAQPAPTAPAPAPRRPAAPPAAARTGIAITVTDMQGTGIAGVRVAISGPTERLGTTDTMGRLQVTGLQVGTYRLRFTHDDWVTFEREVTTRSGRVGDVDVTLNAAPPPAPAPQAPPAPAPAAPTVGPIGRPSATSLLDYLSRNKIRNNEPRREVMISCSGSTRASLVQTNEDQPRRLYENAEVTYYVIDGQGTLKVDVRETAIAVGSFISIPRGTPHEIARRGRAPLIFVAELSGEACQEAK